MGNFNNGNSPRGGRGNKKFNGKRNFDKQTGFGAGWGEKSGFNKGGVMHRATCSDCGANCEVPFRPTGSRPVLCNDCFRDSGSHQQQDRRSNGSERYNDKGSHARFNEKPSFHKENVRAADSYEAQFEQVNRKLDKLMGLFEVVSSLVAEKSAPVTKKTAEKTAAKAVDAKSSDQTTEEVQDKQSTPKKVDRERKPAKKASANKAVAKKKTAKKTVTKKNK